MKKLMLMFIAVLGMTTATFAQKTAEQKEAKQAKEMKEGGKKDGLSDFGLTPEQEVKFKALNEAQKKATQKVKSDDTIKDKEAQIAALKSKYEADVKGVMNADQYAKWLAKREERKEKKEAKKAEKKKGKSKSDNESKVGGGKPE